MRYLPILLLVLILGCTGTQSTPLSAKATAVSIKSFTSDMDQVYEDGEFTLNLLVENEGAFEATDVVADLFLVGAFRPINGDTWVTNAEAAEKKCIEDCGDDAPCKADCTKDQAKALAEKLDIFWTKPARRMRAPDIELEVPGDMYEYRWELLAPDNIGTAIQEYPFTFKVDLGYDYKSSAWAQVPLLKYSRIQQLKQSDQSLPESQSEEFPSPISIDVNFQEPVLFKKSGDPVELRVVLNHNQGGFIKADETVDNKDEMGCSCCGEQLNCIDNVTITPPVWLMPPIGASGEGGTFGAALGEKETTFELLPDIDNFRYYLKADVCLTGKNDGEVKVSISGKEVGRIKPLHLVECDSVKNWEVEVTEYLTKDPTIRFEYVFKDDKKPHDAVKVSNVKIVPECDFERDGNTLIANFVKLIDGKQAVLSCGLNISTETGEDELYPTFKVDADYRYHVVGEESVTVIKGA